MKLSFKKKIGDKWLYLITLDNGNQFEELLDYPFFDDLCSYNGDKIVRYDEVGDIDEDMYFIDTPYNYSQRNGGTIDSCKYYNNYRVLIKEEG